MIKIQARHTRLLQTRVSRSLPPEITEVTYGLIFKIILKLKRKKHMDLN